MNAPETLPAPPPRHWEADVLLRDGRIAHIRPILPEDESLMVEFYARVSDESKYYRFFTPMPVLSDRDLHRFTHVDYTDRVAFVLLVGGKMIAVGRYDMVTEGEAEVAFLVEDAHQGRGIGQLLLEHLAQAGRERGIERFVAEVLPDNQAMIHTFRDAGYRLVSGYEDGLMMLEFPIDPTETAIGVMEAREHRAEAASIERFFNPRTVAVIGASRRQDTIGQALVRNLVMGDFAGRVYAVNQAATAVSGMPAYASVNDIPDDIDVAIVAVPADAVNDVVLDCAAKGVHGLIVISSGFAETGEDGRSRQRKLVALSRSYGLRLIGPNCLGVINTAPSVSLNASLSTLMPPRGRAGFFCQSGALGTAILEKVNNRGLGLSTFVSAGNRADVSGNDLLQYWEEDERTEVVLLYLESIGNPRKFSRIARRVSERKPVIAVRSGRTTQGVPRGTPVAGMPTPIHAVDAMFRQAGVIQVDTLDEMFDVAQLVAHQPLPRGRRVAVVDNSDALGLLAADAGHAVGLDVVSTTALGADATAEDFEDALDEAIDREDVDAIIAVYIPPLNVSGEDVANVLAAVGEQSDKPLVSTFLGAEGIPELLRVPDVAGHTAGRGSVPSYPAVESAVRALARVIEYATWLHRTTETLAGTTVPSSSAQADQATGSTIDGVDSPAAKRLVNELLRRHPGGHDLSAAERAELLATYGIALWETVHVSSLDEALAAGERLGWDVVLKATTDRLRNRPDLSHVWRQINDAEAMHDAWENLSGLASPEEAGFVVQRNAPPGVPLAIMGVEDPLFGPVVSFGVSGPLTDLLADKAYRTPPLSRQDAADLIREIKSAPLLFGYRGGEDVDIAAVESLVRRVAQLQFDLPQLRCLDLSLVLAGGQGTAVLTSTIRVEPVMDPRSGWYVRRLDRLEADTMPG